jgi:glycerophosphoryl diester phosphodiesterase
LCDELQLAVNLEIKPTAGQEAVTGATVAALAASYAPRAGLLLSSFALPALEAARDMAPTLPRALLVEAIPGDWVEQMKLYGCMALHASASKLDVEMAKAVIAADVPLVCYTVNQRQRADALFALGITAIFSDRPDLM